MDISNEEGLSSEEAWDILRSTVSEELCEYKQKPEFGTYSCIKESFSRNFYSPLNWLGIGVTVLEIGLLFWGYALGSEYRDNIILFECCVVIILLLAITIICSRETYLRRQELFRNIENAFMPIGDPTVNTSYRMSLSLSVPSSPAVSLAWTYRDKTLVNLPWNMLVEGDVILLGPSNVAPAKVKELCPEGKSLHCPVVLDSGTIFNPPYLNDRDEALSDDVKPVQSQPHPKRKFLILEAPIRHCIRQTITKGLNRPQSVMNNEMKEIVELIHGKIFPIIAFITVFISFVRLKFLPEISSKPGEAVFVTTAYTLLPLLPITLPLLWTFTQLYGSARIGTLFDISVKKMFFEENEELSLDHVDMKRTLKLFYEMICGEPRCLPRTTNLLFSLGSATVFCCVDKDGILCFPNPVPEKLFLFADPKVKKQKQLLARRESTSAFDQSTSTKCIQEETQLDVKSQNSVDVGDYVHRRGSEILGISYDPEGLYGIQFEDVDWKSHINVLKALGLNALLNCPNLSPLRNVQYEELIEHLSLNANPCPLPNPRRCLCLLPKAIGFHDRVIENFKRRQCITAFRTVHIADETMTPSNSFLSIIKEKHVPNFVSSIVEDQTTGLLQLLSQGSGEMLLEASTDYWDGTTLNELTVNTRRLALNFFQRMNITGHCVAFGYKPILKAENIVHGDDLFVEYPPSSQFANIYQSKLDEVISFAESEKERKSSNPLNKDYSVKNLLENVPNKENAEAINRVLSNQIFIGMATLQYVVKEDVVRLVEELDNGGIRFVHFSNENELRSRVFCERLGLETGWNCHISLSEHLEVDIDDEDSISSECDQQETDNLLEDGRRASTSNRLLKRQSSISLASTPSETQQDDADYHNNFFFMGNRAKLPRGIGNIRPHLEHVDDVPLLVPLFTDCIPTATAEMISIMQEYGEVVCCVGSSLNMQNADIYCRADVSIAVEPLHPQSCLRTGIQNFKCGSPCLSNIGSITDTNSQFNGLDSPLLLSSMLNGMGCSLSCHRNDNFRIIAILCEARRITFGLRSCWTFLLSSHLSLSAILFMAMLFVLPYPLTGSQLLWLIIIILPILSVSLIGTPADGHTMNSMTGKKGHQLKDTARIFMLQFVCTFFVSSCFCSLIVFPWIFHSLCLDTSKSSDCHYILGQRANATADWNGMMLPSARKVLCLSQDLTLLSASLNLIALSASYVHRSSHVWQRSPLLNKPWIFCVGLCLLLQLLYTTFSLINNSLRHPGIKASLIDVPLTIYLFIFMSPMLLFGLAELIKKRYIKSSVRFQKRARLKFDTKLGMNSPV